MVRTKSSHDGIAYHEYRGERDDVPVIHVETDPEVVKDGPNGPEFRLYVNDELVYEGVPLKAAEDNELTGAQDPSWKRL